MVAESKTHQMVVQPDGSVTIPAEVLDRAGIKPGDEVYFWTTGQGNLSAVRLPKLTIDEIFARYGDPTITEIDWEKVREEAENDTATAFVEEMRRNG
jgi:bifunctional DNA-binding transcriptional regulator/antitoxin component of YhaV-PrlF toxin-antitoxin module